MINYQEIINNLNIEKIKDLLDKLEVPYIEKDTYLQCKTACHNVHLGSASNKLYIYKDSFLFYCYTECYSMNIFQFLEHYYEVRGISYSWKKDILNVVLNCSTYNKMLDDEEIYQAERDKYFKEQLKELEAYDPSVMASFIKTYPPEWLEDNISEEAMDKYDIRYSISQNKIIIPHYDVDGRLIGIRGRALNPWDIEQGKYKPIQANGILYRHELSLNLYGLYENKENISKYGYCLIAEGEKSVLQAESFSMPNCTVAVGGSNFNKFQMQLLMRSAAPSNIVICFDKEELPNEDYYFNKLYNMCKKYNSQANFSFIYDTDDLLELKDSPFDKGEEVFKKLLEKRVIVK